MNLSLLSLKGLLGESVKAKAMRSAAWVILGFGSQQLIRLGSNLILTRLLFPELFGLMAIASIFIAALSMISDLGFNTSVVQNKRGGTPGFLNTIWSLQILRGLIIWLLSVLVSYPAALIYDQPILMPLFAVLGASAFISGFNSMAWVLAEKNLGMGKRTLIEISSQVISTILMILIAYLYKSIWSLALSSIFAATITLALSHFYLTKHKHKFSIDIQDIREIAHFGKWILATSVIGFLANQIDRIVLSKAFSLEELAFYTIAVTLAQIPKMISSKVGAKVLTPIYAHLQDRSTAELRQRSLRMRMMLAAITLPMGICLIVFGEELISILYDERYHGAGGMLEILAIGASITIATESNAFLLGLGDSKGFFHLVLYKLVILVGSIYIGFEVAGAMGIIYGISISPLIYYIALAFTYRKYGLWLWRLDLALLLIILAAVFLGYYM